MAEEASSQPGMSLDTLESSTHASAQAPQIVGRGIGQSGGVQMRPELFDRIQFGGVSREPLHVEPRAMALDGSAGEPTAVGREPIPQQNDWVPPMAFERGEKTHHLRSADPAAVQGQQPTRTLSVGFSEQRTDPGEPFPIERFDQPRGLSLRSPRGPDRRAL